MLAWPRLNTPVRVPGIPKTFLLFTSLIKPPLDSDDTGRLFSLITERFFQWFLLAPDANLTSFKDSLGHVRLIMVTHKDPLQPQLSRDTGYAVLEMFQQMLYYYDPLQGMGFSIYERDPPVKTAGFYVHRLRDPVGANVTKGTVTDEDRSEFESCATDRKESAVVNGMYSRVREVGTS